jgi:choline/glycine/proline betaine transport protein
MSDNSKNTRSAPPDRPVFYGSAIILVLIVLTAALLPEATNAFFDRLLDGIVQNGSWYYVLVVTIIVVSVVFFAFSRYGDIKLGPDHAEPEYSNLSWFAMLFAAGMGIGLMFFGVAEPVMHFLDPPRGEPGSVDAAREAMVLTFFHWGIHAWSIYAIVALILAYFGYRHDLPLTLRSALYPLIGERIYGPIGSAIDIFAIIGTTAGVATSLGFGVEQINAGLNHVFGVPKNVWVQFALVVGTTAAATVSLVAGLDAGIKRLSEINIVLAIALLIGVLAVGPTVLILQTFVQNTGDYLSEIVGKTFNLYAYDPTDWLGGWTIFYWGWWMSWAPFVGLFIARISRGRTLREFVMGAMLVPALFTLFWMTVFGNSAIELILHDGMPGLGEAVQADTSVALFRFLEYFPLSDVLSTLAVLMVLVFFVTSADSGAMVLNMLSSNGRDDTPTARRVFWMVMIGATAVVLLFAGGLASLQTAAIAGALPFSLALMVAIWGFAKALRIDDVKRQSVMVTTFAPATVKDPLSWQQRVQMLLSYPMREQVLQMQEAVVLPVMQAFAAELDKNGVAANVTDARDDADSVRLEAHHGDEVDFVYEVVAKPHPLPDRALVSKALKDLDSREKYFRAEVHLGEGGQDYDLMGWTREQIATDIFEQYKKHLQFLHVLR